MLRQSKCIWKPIPNRAKQNKSETTSVDNWFYEQVNFEVDLVQFLCLCYYFFESFHEILINSTFYWQSERQKKEKKKKKKKKKYS